MNILLIILVPLATLAIYGIARIIINTINYNNSKKAIYDLILTLPNINTYSNIINTTSLKDDVMFTIDCVLNIIKKMGYNIDDMIKNNNNKELIPIITENIEKCNMKLHLALFLTFTRVENCSPDKILNYIKTKFPDNIVVDKKQFEKIQSSKEMNNEIIELCKVTCAEGMTVCNNKCVDLNIPDNYNCGNCGIACGDQKECRIIQESPGNEKVFKCLDKCYDPATNNTNVCSQNETCCGNGKCINLNNPDNFNCGECGNNCEVADFVCKKLQDQNNYCVAPSFCTNDTHCDNTQICCNSKCVNILDNTHCGNCETMCLDNETCINTDDGYKCMPRV